MFMANRIENLSLADSQVLQATVVTVGYDSDVDLVMRLLTAAAREQERVLHDPGPGVNLTNFGPDGLEFTLNYWMIDPENGQQNLRSLVNLAVLRALRANDIQIPFPQRVMHASAPLASSMEKMSQALESRANPDDVPASKKPPDPSTEN